MLIRFFGNALFTIEHSGFKILIDPFFSRNPKIYQPKAEDFDDIDAVLITHGHFDHIKDLPALLKRKPSLDIYCTKRVKKNLDKIGCKHGTYYFIGVDDKFNVGPFNVQSISSRHIVFDFPYIAKHAIMPEFYLGLGTTFKTTREHSQLKTDGECIEFLIEAGGETVLVSGSLGKYKNIKHPEKVDVFLLPYNGRWVINKQMLEHVEHIKPKKIIMSHFDATFPPLCLDAKPQRFVDFMKKEIPEIEVIIPEYTRAYKAVQKPAEIIVHENAIKAKEKKNPKVIGI